MLLSRTIWREGQEEAWQGVHDDGEKMINQASIESYREFSEEQLGDRQRKVYECIRWNNQMTNRQIADELGWPINSVTGRVRELVQMGMVYSLGRIYDEKTDRRVNEWAVIE